ncbi:major facilitator superfamily-domain-containing protein [Zychaea mexicana]|uniref:major facilitator superfamily-domain-containing protein n=1 Tax=Zychaea mexicana TaxID=64656 RepID=UPI0022FF39C9|nr:major facilitator superfamily-domain-containing protein [Zychaea mexicana]KAI9477101.1 major facilitator superfamily-domain-containing protein [Zychaea mexicana]
MDRIMVSTALPQIASEFGVASMSTWVATSYILTNTAFMPLCTKFSDIFGRKVIILSGIITVMLGSLLGGLSQSFGMLLAGRAIQGLGCAGIYMIIADIVPLRQRGLYQSVIDTVYALSYTISPLLGGVFSQYLSWRWIFYINLPLGAVSFTVLTFLLKLPTSRKGNFIDKVKRIDFAGIIILMACVVVFLIALNFGGRLYPWNSTLIVLLLLTSGILLLILLLVESKFAKEPLIPIKLLSNRSLIGSFTSNAVFGGVYTSALYFLPNYFQVVKGDEPIWASFRILPLLLVIPVISITVGILISRFGIYRFFITGSMIVMAVGTGLISTFTVDTPWNGNGEHIHNDAIMFTGVAPMFSSIIISVQAVVPPSDVATATGVSFLLFDVGAAVGVAITYAVLNTKLDQMLPSTTIPAGMISAIVQDPTAIRRILPQRYLQTALRIYASSLQEAWHVLIAFPAIGFVASLLIKHFVLRKRSNNDCEKEDNPPTN